MKIDKKIIKELTDYLNEFNLTEIEYTEKDTKIKVSKSNSSISNQSIIAPNTSSASVDKVAAETTSEIISGIQVTSPIIGTAYHSPELCVFLQFHNFYI